VKLKPLASGDSHGMVPVLIRELIQRQIELRGDKPAGRTGSQHELIVFFLPFNPVIAIVLLVGTMKFKNLYGITTEMGGVFQQLAGYGFA